jgi:hypothetical protein
MRKVFRGGSAMRRYYLHKRKGIYYAELVFNGYKLAARSTKKTSEHEALLVVSRWPEKGLPGKGGKIRPVETAYGFTEIVKAIRKTDMDGNDAMKIVNSLKERGLIDVSIVKAGNGAKVFTDFLEEFWDYNRSPYVREKKAHGHFIGKRHCYEMISRVHSFYDVYFAGCLSIP